MKKGEVIPATGHDTQLVGAKPAKMCIRDSYFCEALEGDLVIPDGVTSLSAGLFYNGFALTSITIPDGAAGLVDGDGQIIGGGSVLGLGEMCIRDRALYSASS